MAITITVQLFGAFRRHHSPNIVINTSAPCSVLALKQMLTHQWLGTPLAALVAQSVLANDNSVLADDDVCDHSCELAILPPVCGG